MHQVSQEDHLPCEASAMIATSTAAVYAAQEAAASQVAVVSAVPSPAQKSEAVAVDLAMPSLAQKPEAAAAF